MNKFKIGDKVRIKPSNGRTPQYVREVIRLRQVRTIVAIFYDSKTQHTRYYLGSNKLGIDLSDYHFRASQLEKVKSHIGRKREKRIYRNKVGRY